MSSFEIFGARRRLSDLSGAVFETVFYDVMDLILDAGEWQSYFDDVNGKTVTFDSMDDFLTHADGLAISDLGLFQRCMKAVASCPSKASTRASALLKRLSALGMSQQVVKPEPIAEHEIGVLGGKAGPGRGNKTGDNVTGFSERGNSQSYMLRRIARDFPEELEEIGKDKKHKSVRKAAIALSIVKDVPTVRLADPTKAAQSIVQRVGVEFATQLAIELADLAKQASAPSLTPPSDD